MKELDYWRRINLIWPTVHASKGSGDHQLWSLEDARIIRTIVLLRHAGVSLNQIAWTGTVTVLRAGWHDWQGWLIVTATEATITSNPTHAAELITAEARPVAVLNLAHTTLIEPEATVA